MHTRLPHITSGTLQNEDDADYGPVILPETAVTDLITKRTEDHLKLLNATVSAKPICMRVEFAFCPNLTIIDTPGLILKAKKGQQEDCPDAILDMVKTFIAPPHRLVLFLQQSSVEWASSLWMHVIQVRSPCWLSKRRYKCSLRRPNAASCFCSSPAPSGRAASASRCALLDHNFL